MTTVRVIGVDPGPTPGLVLVRYNNGPFAVCHVVQCNHGVAPAIFETLLMIDPSTPTYVQIEQFVVSRRAGRSANAKAGEVTRDLIGALRETWAQTEVAGGRLGGWFYVRPAAQVKPWATDERLDAAGLLTNTDGMRHARDAARHALFCAVHDGGIPDPLSARSWL